MSGSTAAYALMGLASQGGTSGTDSKSPKAAATTRESAANLLRPARTIPTVAIARRTKAPGRPTKLKGYVPRNSRQARQAPLPKLQGSPPRIPTASA